MKRRLHDRPGAPRCVLDSGGLTGLVGRSQRARAWLRWLVEHGGEVVLPTPVLVESATGDPRRDAGVDHVIGVLRKIGGAIRPPSESVARLAGQLRFASGVLDVVDALVAAEAQLVGSTCVVLTSDPSDLRRLVARSGSVTVVVV